MQVCMIAAMDEQRAIGFKGQMPWNIPGEQRIFRELTVGNGLILGRRTFESIGRVLPGRTTVVMTRSNVQLPKEVLVARSAEEAIRLAEPKSKSRICVGGGTEIYKVFMPLADTIYVTKIHASFVGDTFFPEIDSNFSLAHSQTVDGPISYTYQTFERRAPG